MIIITPIMNRIYFKFCPSKIIKNYTGKSARRMYFIREYELAMRQLWRAEFFRSQKEELLEEIRREYDKANETLDAINVRLEEEEKKEDKDKVIMEALMKQKEGKTKDVAQFKEQIDHIDTEVKGYGEAIDSLRTTFPLLEAEVNK